MDSHVSGSESWQGLQLWSWLSPTDRKRKLISRRVWISVNKHGSLSQGGRDPIKVSLPSRDWLISSRNDAIFRAQHRSLLLADWNVVKTGTRSGLVNGNLHSVTDAQPSSPLPKAYSGRVPNVPVLEWLTSTGWVIQRTWLFSASSMLDVL